MSSTARKPLLVERQAGAREPRRGARLGDDEHRVGLLPLAVLEPDRAALDALGAGVLEQPDAAALEDRAQPAARRLGLAGQDLVLGGERDLQAGRLGDLAQPMVDRQRQLDAARAAADHHDVERPQPALHALAELEPAPAQLGDRLDRDRPLLGPRDRPDVGRRADIDRQQVVGDAPAGPSAAPAAGRDRCRSPRHGPAARPSGRRAQPGRCGIPRSCSGRRRSPGSCRSRASRHRGRPASPARPAAAARRTA